MLKNKLMVLEKNTFMKNVESAVFLVSFHEVCDIWECYNHDKGQQELLEQI